MERARHADLLHHRSQGCNPAQVDRLPWGEGHRRCPGEADPGGGDESWQNALSGRFTDGRSSRCSIHRTALSSAPPFFTIQSVSTGKTFSLPQPGVSSFALRNDYLLLLVV